MLLKVSLSIKVDNSLHDVIKRMLEMWIIEIVRGRLYRHT